MTNPVTIGDAIQGGHMPDGRTHYPGCWRDRRHHDCAVHQIESLSAENARLRSALERISGFDCEAMTHGDLKLCGSCPSCVADMALENVQ